MYGVRCILLQCHLCGDLELLSKWRVELQLNKGRAVTDSWVSTRSSQMVSRGLESCRPCLKWQNKLEDLPEPRELISWQRRLLGLGRAELLLTS